MNITKEMLEQQREEYIKRRQELANQVNALSGAIDDCNIWLKVLEAEEIVEDGAVKDDG